MIILTLAQIKALAERMENAEKHSNMKAYVKATIKKHPNGRQYMEFEQPCCYAECSSAYYRYDGKDD